MKVPGSVRVAGRRVRIQYVPQVPGDDPGTYVYAETDGENAIIRVSTTMHTSAEQVWHTLQHEVFHYALFVAGHGAWLGERREEAVVQGLENVLWGVFRFNPRAVTWRDVDFTWEE